MQVPSVGRKVWFWGGSSYGFVGSESQPFDATVVYVHGPSCVNLRVTDHNGTTRVCSSVMLRDPQEGDKHGVGYVATWMPYQVKQHEKNAS